MNLSVGRMYMPYMCILSLYRCLFIFLMLHRETAPIIEHVVKHLLELHAQIDAQAEVLYVAGQIEDLLTYTGASSAPSAATEEDAQVCGAGRAHQCVNCVVIWFYTAPLFCLLLNSKHVYLLFPPPPSGCHSLPSPLPLWH